MCLKTGRHRSINTATCSTLPKHPPPPVRSDRTVYLGLFARQVLHAADTGLDERPRAARPDPGHLRQRDRVRAAAPPGTSLREWWQMHRVGGCNTVVLFTEA